MHVYALRCIMLIPVGGTTLHNMLYVNFVLF
uniref:Uncharacterized protein n=1 Tax=Aegilops tauschii subsp. strangulata TaxID=200361 RepID=A0A453II72_AEGTS